MSTKEKLIERIKSVPSDFSFSEAQALAALFGYTECSKGHTSGSRVMFIRFADNRKILLHKPHPGSIMKQYSVKDLLNAFIRNGDIS